jgi:hypothetical protein
MQEEILGKKMGAGRYFDKRYIVYPGDAIFQENSFALHSSA